MVDTLGTTRERWLFSIPPLLNAELGFPDFHLQTRVHGDCHEKHSTTLLLLKPLSLVTGSQANGRWASTQQCERAMAFWSSTFPRLSIAKPSARRGSQMRNSRDHNVETHEIS